jgi:hypothetical protein
MAGAWPRRAAGLVTGSSFEQKKRYRRYRARVERLPASYRTTVEARAATEDTRRAAGS